MNDELLAEYELKARRASFHLAALRQSIDEAAVGRGDPILGVSNPGRTQHRFEVTMPIISADWGLVVGDFCYDDRAALDYLLTALVRGTGGTENQDNQFPIFGPRDFASWADAETRWDDDPGGTLKRYLR